MDKTALPVDEFYEELSALVDSKLNRVHLPNKAGKYWYFVILNLITEATAEFP